jgi:WD40 repeat protein
VLDVHAVVEDARPLLVALHGDRLALVGKSVALIDTSNGRLRKTHLINGPDGARFAAVAAFPQGGRIAASMGDRSLRIFDVETGKQVGHTMTDALSSGVAISPDGKLIAQVDALTGVVSIRDTKTLQPTGRDLVAPGFVTDLTWLHDGGRLATSSTDGSVHYWDIAERKQLAELPHGSKVEYVLAAPQGSVVYSAGLGVVREWDLNPPRAAGAACTEAGRNLTRDEWDTYLGGDAYRKTCP